MHARVAVLVFTVRHSPRNFIPPESILGDSRTAAVSKMSCSEKRAIWFLGTVKKGVFAIKLPKMNVKRKKLFVKARLYLRIRNKFSAPLKDSKMNINAAGTFTKKPVHKPNEYTMQSAGMESGIILPLVQRDVVFYVVKLLFADSRNVF